MSFPAKLESPHMFSKPFVVSSMPVCMQSFRQLIPKAAAPFRASFHGFAVEVGQLDMTANGHPKRFFVLVDGSGIWLPCVVVRQHAENSEFRDGMELLLYFCCTARGQIGSLTGAVNLMKDAVAVGLKQHGVVSSKRTPAQIVDQQSKVGTS